MWCWSTSTISSMKRKGGRCGTAASTAAGVSALAAIESPVHVHDTAVHVAPARGEEGDDIGHLGRRAHPAEGNARQDPVAGRLGERRGHVGVDEAGRDRVDEDRAAGELVRERLGE